MTYRIKFKTYIISTGDFFIEYYPQVFDSAEEASNFYEENLKEIVADWTYIVSENNKIIYLYDGYKFDLVSTYGWI